MDFAPYQSSPPEHIRSTTASPRTSLETSRRSSPQYQYQQRPSRFSPPPLQHPQPQRAWNSDSISRGYRSPDGLDNTGGNYWAQNGGPGAGRFVVWLRELVGNSFSALAAREGTVSELFDTSLGLRLDYEACLAYLAFPPLGAILLLILERKSDYVRFHAWQSALLFTALFVVYLVFSWSTFLSWVLFLGDLVLIGWLALNAYRDADTLDRYEVPIIGPLASRILDDE